MTPKELWNSWKHVVATERITEEPTDDRPLRSLLNVWRRRTDGLWATDRNPNGGGVTFSSLSKTLQLRELAPMPTAAEEGAGG
jgi:hypothetical protein